MTTKDILDFEALPAELRGTLKKYAKAAVEEAIKEHLDHDIFLSRREAAEFAGVSQDTITRVVNEGKLKPHVFAGHQTPRYLKADVRALIVPRNGSAPGAKRGPKPRAAIPEASQ